MEISSHIVESYIDLPAEFSPYSELPTPSECDAHDKGTIYAYACETLCLCLLLQEFKDAVQEGDRER